MDKPAHAFNLHARMMLPGIAVLLIYVIHIIVWVIPMPAATTNMAGA